jgi:hypothetical protein
MAHFAKLGPGNIVEKVIVVSNDIATDEATGVAFLRNLYKEPDAVWKQTSYNQNFRKNYAGKGFRYDETRDAFIPAQAYPSWILDEDTCLWKPPVPQPEGNVVWNELHRRWEEVIL